MNSPAVNDWRQHGKVSVWRYRNASKGYSGIHLSGDTASVVSLLELFATLKRSSNAHRTVNLRNTTPTVASIPGVTRAFDTYSKIKLKYDESFPGTVVTINGEILEVECGRSGIDELIHAFQQYDGGENDFCIRADIRGGTKQDARIWFW